MVTWRKQTGSDILHMKWIAMGFKFNGALVEQYCSLRMIFLLSK